MAAKEKNSKAEQKPTQGQPDRLEVVSGNTEVLTVQFLAAINRQLSKIISLLEKN